MPRSRRIRFAVLLLALVGAGTAPPAGAGGTLRPPARQELRGELRRAPPPPAHLVLDAPLVVRRSGGVLRILAPGQPIAIYVRVRNVGPPGSRSTSFRVYLWREGRILRKGRAHAPARGLRGGLSTYARFPVRAPERPGRQCWRVSLEQPPDGRMILGPPRRVCAWVARPLPDRPFRR